MFEESPLYWTASCVPQPCEPATRRRHVTEDTPETRPASSHPPTRDVGTIPASDLADLESDSRTAATPVAPEHPVPEIPGYEVLGVLGQGGMGVVYKAIDLQLRRHVAIKMVATGPVVTEAARERFHSEARAVAVLQHPNIAQVFLAETIESRPFFVMEYVDGGTLAEVITGEPQPPRYAAELVSKLADAVDFSHGRNVLHRDLKPGNVLITQDGEPKIADFGLAKFLDGDSSATKTGDILGTPSYMSPEQAGGVVKNIGRGSDIYSLGAILYELLTGRPPFRTPDAMQTVLMVLSDDPVPPRQLQPTVPKDLETICLKCLEKLPSKRYSTARHLADDLRRFLAGEAIHARPVGRLERLWKWVQRHPAWAALAAVCVVGIIGSVAAGFYHNRQIEQSLAETEAERDRAQRLFDSGHKLAKFLASKHYRKLEKLPGGAGPREELSSNLIDYLVRLEKNAEDNTELLTDLANAYEQIAFVQGNPYGENRGAKDEALKNYRKALELRRRLVDLQPGAARPRLQLELCRAQIADIEFQMGKVKSARKDYTQILQRLKTLGAQFPDDNRVRAGIIDVIGRLGDADEADENIPTALQKYEDAVKRASELKSSDEDRQWVHASIRNQLHFRMGQLLEKLKRIDEAEKHYQKVYAYAKRISGGRKDDVFNRARMSRALIALGDIQTNRRQFATARKTYLTALKLRRDAQRDDPNSDSVKGNLAVVLSRIGTAISADSEIKPADRAKRAAAYIEEAMQIREGLAARRRKDIDAVKNLAILQRELADVLSPTPQIRRAERLFRACMASAERLKLLHKDSLLAEELTAESLRGLATIEFVTGDEAYLKKDLATAKRHYENSLSLFKRALAIWKAYHIRNPESPRTKRLEQATRQIQQLIEDSVKKKLQRHGSAGKGTSICNPIPRIL